jgi:hypothetical protein
MINMTPVSSDNILAIGYEAASLTLQVEFKDGHVYQYFDVPMAVYEEFMNPPGGSHGKYLAAHIKGQYRYARL